MGRCSLGKEVGQIYPLAHLQGLGECTDSLGEEIIFLFYMGKEQRIVLQSICLHMSVF